MSDTQNVLAALAWSNCTGQHPHSFASAKMHDKQHFIDRGIRNQEWLREQGLAIVPVEPTEEMKRVFCATTGQEGVDWDELVPRTGTGQGDLEMIPEYEKVWDDWNFYARYKAMLAASLDGDEK